MRNATVVLFLSFLPVWVSAQLSSGPLGDLPQLPEQPVLPQVEPVELIEPTPEVTPSTPATATEQAEAPSYRVISSSEAYVVPGTEPAEEKAQVAKKQPLSLIHI